jgi:hypothetical protein
LFEKEIKELNNLELVDKNIEYSGALSNNLRDGKGHLVIRRGQHYISSTDTFYSGPFVKGKRHGFGLLWFGESGKRVFNY